MLPEFFVPLNAFLLNPCSCRRGIIDWKEGEVHIMDNHKQFAFVKKEKEQDVILLVFYSDKHQSIFTHHTTNMHVHILEQKSGTEGYLDNIQIDDLISIYLPGE